MARKKQVPLQRKPSGFGRGLPESPSSGWKQANGTSEKSTAVTSNGNPKQSAPVESQEPAGLAQLLVCIAGIYASLLVIAISLLDDISIVR